MQIWRLMLTVEINTEINNQLRWGKVRDVYLKKKGHRWCKKLPQSCWCWWQEWIVCFFFRCPRSSWGWERCHACNYHRERPERDVHQRAIREKDIVLWPHQETEAQTMAETKKKFKLKTSQRKVKEYKQQGDIAIQLMVKAQSSGSQLDLREFFDPCSLLNWNIGTTSLLRQIHLRAYTISGRM